MQLERNGKWKRGKYFEKNKITIKIKKSSFSGSDLKDRLDVIIVKLNNFVTLCLLKVKGDACFTL